MKNGSGWKFGGGFVEVGFAAWRSLSCPAALVVEIRLGGGFEWEFGDGVELVEIVLGIKG